MWILYRRLTAAFLLKAILISSTMATILAVAAWVDLGNVKLWQQFVRSVPSASAMAAIWVLWDWRKQGGVTILAAGGHSPVILIPWMLLIACPLFSWRTNVNDPASSIVLRPIDGYRLQVVLDGNATEYHEKGHALSRQRADSPTASLNTFPRHVSLPRHQPHPNWPFWARMLMLCSTMLWMLLKPQKPKGSHVLVVTSLCIASANALSWISEWM